MWLLGLRKLGHRCSVKRRTLATDTAFSSSSSEKRRPSSRQDPYPLALGLAACQRGFPTLFITAHALSSQLMEARDEKRLLRLQAQLQKVKLLIVDELGYVPLSQVGAELLFEVFSQRYERGSVIVTSNLPFEEWPSVFRSERLTGALLDRLTHHVHILEMNGESYRLRQSAGRRRRTEGAEQNQATTTPRRDRRRSRRRHTPQRPTDPPSTNGRSLATALLMARFASGLHQRRDWPELPRPTGREFHRR